MCGRVVSVTKIEEGSRPHWNSGGLIKAVNKWTCILHNYVCEEKLLLMDCRRTWYSTCQDHTRRDVCRRQERRCSSSSSSPSVVYALPSSPSRSPCSCALLFASLHSWWILMWWRVGGLMRGWDASSKEISISDFSHFLSTRALFSKRRKVGDTVHGP